MAGKTKKPIWVIAMLLVAGVALWGKKTQAQQARGRDSGLPDILGKADAPYLSDFSYAGYHWSEVPLPNVKGVVFDVTDYGAIPDDREDDTEAIRQALDEAHASEASQVIVRFPAGQFITRKILFIERDGLVIRGSGAKRTTLHAPRPLPQMDAPAGFENPLPGNTMQSSWRGGVLWARTRQCLRSRWCRILR